MKGRTHTTKIVFLFAGVVLLSAGMVYGLFWFIRYNSQKTVEYENLVQERLDADANAIKVKTTVERERDTIEVVKSRIIPAEGIATFIEMLGTLARRFSLSFEVQSANESDHSVNKDYKLLVLTMRSQGSWAATYQFLSALESLPYKSSVGSVSLQSQIVTEPSTASSTRSRTVWIGTYTLNVVRFK
jgi:hypothetical protein